MPDYAYLYGFSANQVSDLRDMPYVEALHHKIKHGKLLINELLSTPFMEQDTHRVNKCLKAVKFNQELIKEVS